MPDPKEAWKWIVPLSPMPHLSPLNRKEVDSFESFLSNLQLNLPKWNTNVAFIKKTRHYQCKWTMGKGRWQSNFWTKNDTMPVGIGCALNLRICLERCSNRVLMIHCFWTVSCCQVLLPVQTDFQWNKCCCSMLFSFFGRIAKVAAPLYIWQQRKRIWSSFVSSWSCQTASLLLMQR